MNKSEIQRIYNNFTGGGSFVWRAAVGNFPRQQKNNKKPWIRPPNYNEAKKNMNILISYMKPHKLPVLYKGFKGKNAENLRTNGYFNAKTPTSASKNNFQAKSFAIPGGILLTLPANTRLSIVPENNGLTARQPREQEVTLAPQRFELKNYKYENFKK